jgi:inorganic phosphate transporter, PiT family
MLLTILLVMILVALVFEFINGFHDTANSIATVVGTKVLTPRQAIVLAATTNLAGALVGNAVAKTITSGLINDQMLGQQFVQQMIICAMLGGIVWNLITWYFGIPSSSTHAMVGGLIGASLGISQMNWDVLIWSEIDGKGKSIGIFHKVIVPMITSPVAGFLIGFLVMGILFALLRNARPAKVNSTFGKLQIVSSGYMGWMHGMSDAQKVMGVITMGLLAMQGQELPDFLKWMGHVPTDMKGEPHPPIWVKVTCALVMAAGTAMGGWRIIKTLGHKMVKLQPIHGFAAETTAATVLAVAQYNGMPVSTTHSITTSIMGVGCAKRFSALKFSLVQKIIMAWILTIPASALVAYLMAKLFRALGLLPGL